MDTQTNFPNATAEDWTVARRIVFRAAVRAGHDRNTAEDMAQNALLAMRHRRYRSRSPISPRIAAAWTVATCRRWGWNDITDPSARPRGRFPDKTAQALEFHTMAVYRQRSATLTPSEAVARAEEWGALRRAAAVRRTGAQSLVDAVLASQGIGPTAAVHEYQHTPSIYGVGQPQPLPTAGAPGLHTACDPSPGSHARAAADVARHQAERLAG